MNNTPIDWAAQDWEDVVPRLLLLAVMRLSRSALQDGKLGASASVAEAQGYVDAVVSKAMSGTSDWDSFSYSLFDHLAPILVRDIAHATGSRGGRLSANGLQDVDEPWRLARRSLVDYLYEKDERLGEMASLMLLEDCLDTTELAEALAVVPVEVSNMRRRMKGEVRAYIAEHGA